uniref:BED-type domain-containing protein n=2 Tax=Aegilops tauschii subsp. strangulata TaxID=200361 RepID=A0A453HS48_AEGTS
MNTDSVVIEEDSKEDEAQAEENEAEEVVVRPRRKLTSPVWKEFKKVKVMNRMKAKCNWCSKKLEGEPRNGTKHLLDHLKIVHGKKV